MSSFIRASKYRHVYVEPPKVDQTYKGFRLATVTGEQRDWSSLRGRSNLSHWSRACREQRIARRAKSSKSHRLRGSTPAAAQQSKG